MTPEGGAPVLVLSRVTVRGRWAGIDFDEGGALHLHASEGRVLTTRGEIRFAWRHLTDATLEQATLHLHRAPEALALAGPADLPRAWAHVVAGACEVPELARGLRSLGSARGGDAERQLRFFGPLLAARRRVEAPDAVERRVAQFDAATVSQRLADAVRALAAERHPADPRLQRALGAHLEEALEPCLAALQALADAAEGVHGAVEGLRFVAWRRWTSTLRRVFVEADRSWSAVARHLDP